MNEQVLSLGNKVAQILSVLLGPQIWLPFLSVTTILRSGLNNQQLIILLPSTLLLQVVIPLAYLSLASKLGLATAWDLPKKEERRLFFLIVLITSVISLFIIYLFGTKFLFNLNIILLSLLTFLGLITLYWKISLHTSLNTIGSILINFLFSWDLWFLYLSIPVIFWARLILHKHSIAQLIAGIIISAVFLLLGLKLMGYFN